MLRWLPLSLSCCLIVGFLVCDTGWPQSLQLAPPKAEGSIRIATFNVSMNRSGPNRLTQDLERGNDQIKTIAAIIRSVQPDIILLNEIDYSSQSDNVKLFQSNYLADNKTDILGNKAYPLQHSFSAPVNTGEPSGLDLNNNGRTDDPEDAWGYGRFPGQYGMAVLSRLPIDASASRTFQNLLWSKLKDAVEPIVPETKQPYYPKSTWEQLRLPSKSFWDVVIQLPDRALHLLVSHPTPPGFDGPEDRNGCRNQDEIRLLLHYITPEVSSKADTADTCWVDDQGRKGRLPEGEPFIIAGDLNSDPVDGSSRSQVIRQLLDHQRVQSRPIPISQGAVKASEVQAGRNTRHRGDPAHDTADFNDEFVGNLRADYVLASSGPHIKASGVVWPIADKESQEYELVKKINGASDHHLVWIDLDFSTSQ